MNVSCEHLSVTFDTHEVIRDLTYTFEEGKAYVITGPSGAGKTTLIRVLLGLQAPSAGSVTWDSQPKHLPLHAGCAFQDHLLCEDFTPVDNVAMTFRSPDKDAIKKALLELLPEKALDQSVRELSGGMQKRVAIVRACLSDADILVLDEPFASLDEDARVKVRDFLLSHQRGRLMIITNHDMSMTPDWQEVRVD